MDYETNEAGRPIAPPQYVLFATPCLDHRVSLDFFRSYLDTSYLLSANGIKHGCLQLGGCCYLANARNKLATDFLVQHPDATDLFFLDDDIGWTPEAALKLILRPEGVVAGVYPHKSDNLTFPAQLHYDNEKLTEIDGMFLALTVPTGFLRIRRHVLEKMAETAARYPDPDGSRPGGSPEVIIEIFKTGLNGTGAWLGEDTMFCADWIGQGGNIWIDPDIAFSHTGRKRWTGNLADTLRAFIAQHAPQDTAAAAAA